MMNMNSIHVATITYKELAYIFCESSTCLRYKLMDSGLCSRFFDDMHHFRGNRPYNDKNDHIVVASIIGIY